MANTHSLSIVEADASYAHAPHISAYNVTSITIECWVYRPSSDVTNKQRGLVDKGRDGYNGWSLKLDNNITSSAGEPQKVVWQIRNGGGVSRNALSSIVYPQDTWFHLGATYDGTTMKLYQDGAEVASTSTSGTLATNSIDIYLGRFNDGANSSIDCLIDDVRIWNVARTQAQIDDNKSVELTGSESGLIGYWKLNNAYTDETTNANTLTAVSSPTFSTSVPFTGATSTFIPKVQWLT